MMLRDRFLKDLKIQDRSAKVVTSSRRSVWWPKWGLWGNKKDKNARATPITFS